MVTEVFFPCHIPEPSIYCASCGSRDIKSYKTQPLSIFLFKNLTSSYLRFLQRIKSLKISIAGREEGEKTLARNSQCANSQKIVSDFILSSIKTDGLVISDIWSTPAILEVSQNCYDDKCNLPNIAFLPEANLACFSRQWTAWHSQKSLYRLKEKRKIFLAFAWLLLHRPKVQINTLKVFWKKCRKLFQDYHKLYTTND